MALRQALVLAGSGLAVGLMLGIAASPLLRSVFLFAIANLNPALLAAVSLSLLAIALLAAYAPARRASRIDPIRVLREE